MTAKAYNNIISLPHHRSCTRLPMPERSRAAQFAPFAVLSGYDGVLWETARLTKEQAELAEDRKAELNDRLQQLLACLDSSPTVCITFFEPDSRKTGGAYRTVCGTVRHIDTVFGKLTMADGTQLPISAITELVGSLWDKI